MSTAPGSPVTVEDDELLDMAASPALEYSRVVGTGRLKSTTLKKKESTTPKKKEFKGPEDPQ